MTTSAPPTKEWRFWLIVAGIFAVLAWLLSGVLTPFLLAMLIAYLLDPMARKLNEWRVPRGLSAAIALLLFIALITTMVMVTGPIVRAQITDFVRTLPTYIEQLQNNVWPRLSAFLLEHIPGFSGAKLEANLTQYTGDAVNLAGILVGRVVTGSWALLHVLIYFILTPVITFYLLRDWPSIVRNIDNVLPARHATPIRHELTAINDMISGFCAGRPR